LTHLRAVNQPVLSTPNMFAALRSTLLARFCAPVSRFTPRSSTGSVAQTSTAVAMAVRGTFRLLAASTGGRCVPPSWPASRVATRGRARAVRQPRLRQGLAHARRRHTVIVGRLAYRQLLWSLLAGHVAATRTGKGLEVRGRFAQPRQHGAGSALHHPRHGPPAHASHHTCEDVHEECGRRALAVAKRAGMRGQIAVA
jgi:hypothetical protein